MNRRGFLGFLSLTPIAAPAAAVTSPPKIDQSEIDRAVSVLADYFRACRMHSNGKLVGIKFPTTPPSDVIVAVGEVKWVSPATINPDRALEQMLREKERA